MPLSNHELLGYLPLQSQQVLLHSHQQTVLALLHSPLKLLRVLFRQKLGRRRRLHIETTDPKDVTVPSPATSVPKHPHTEVTYEQLFLRKYQKTEVGCGTTTQAPTNSYHLYCQWSCVLKGPMAQLVDRLQQEGSPPRRFDTLDVGKRNTSPVPWVSFWDGDVTDWERATFHADENYWRTAVW